MKKLGLLVTPLLTISLLANCAGNIPPKPNNCIVSFDSDGGTAINPIEVAFDTPVGEERKPTDPTKASTAEWKYTFDNWYKVKEDGSMEDDPFDFINTHIIEDTTLKAKWTSFTRYYTVTFDSDGGTPIDPVNDVEYDTPVGEERKPTDPTKASTAEWKYTFDNWYKVKEDGSMEDDPFDFINTHIIEDITLKAKWTQAKQKYTITFVNDDGTTVLDKMVDAEYGTEIVYKEDLPTKESTSEFDYTFSGWDPELKDGDVVTGETTYKATFEPSTRLYTISFNTDGGTDVPMKFAEFNERIEKVSEPSKEDAYYYYRFKDWREIKEDGTLGEIVTFPLNVTQDLSLKAEWYKTQKEYYLHIDRFEDNLIYYSDEDFQDEIKPDSSVQILAGQDYDFFVEAKNPGLYANDEYYRVPSTLNMYVKDQPIPLVIDSSYTIEYLEGSYYTKAKITIKSNAIMGNIYVLGNKAINMNYYTLTVSPFGVKYNPISQYQKRDNEAVVHFDNIEGYSRPAIDNICLKIDDKNWMYASDSEAQEYINYNEEEGNLTILANKIDSSIYIAVRSKDYPVLNSLSWDAINQLSIIGWADKVLYIGDVKEDVMINGIYHRVRVIDFNHDDLADGSGKAGITFEFADVITNTNGAVTTCWNNTKDNNRNFPESVLNKFLNINVDCILNKLPVDLKKNIKKVNKYVGLRVFPPKLYYPYLFPLCRKEMTSSDSPLCISDEGTTYKFYKGSGDKNANRIKCPVNSQTPVDYWLRSPKAGDKNSAWKVPTDGKLPTLSNIGHSTGEIKKPPLAIAPGFCI